MSDTVGDALYAASDYSLFGPTSLEDIRCRLSFIAASECNCVEGPHENAIHDLAADDAPAMLNVLEQADATLKQVRHLHRRVHPVFSWRDGGLTIYEPCLGCDGKSGVHPCGCWADEDLEYHCPTCRDEKGRLLPWPCDTARAAYTAEGLS